MLDAAKLLKKTKNGKTINKRVRHRFDKKKDRQTFWERSFELRLILTDKYATFTKITQNVYLTGIGGIVEENIRQYDIKGIVNATWELSLYQIKGIESIRVPVSPYKSSYYS